MNDWNRVQTLCCLINKDYWWKSLGIDCPRKWWSTCAETAKICSCSILEESGFYFNIAYCFFVCFHWCLFTKGPWIILSAVSLCKALLRRSYLFVYIWSLFPRLVQFSSWPLPTGRICNQARWQTQTSSFLTSSPAASAAQQGHWYFCKSRLWVVIYI